MTKIKVVIAGCFRRYPKEISNVFEQFKNYDHFEVIAPQSLEIEKIKNNRAILKSDNPNKSASQIQQDFMDEILKADFLYVANFDSYIGLSVATEIAWAIVNDIPVILMEYNQKFYEGIPSNLVHAIQFIPVEVSLDELFLKDSDSSMVSLEMRILGLKQRARALSKTMGPLTEKSIEKMSEKLFFELETDS